MKPKLTAKQQAFLAAYRVCLRIDAAEQAARARTGSHETWLAKGGNW